MSSTCVLSPNAFNAPQSVVSSGYGGNSDSPSTIPTGRSVNGLGGMAEFASHPALRGWTAAGSNTSSSTPMASSENYNPSGNEVMRGALTLLSTAQPQRLILSVIRTSVDHFALVYPDNRRNLKCVKPAGCINLRGVTCEETLLGNGITGITLHPKKCDTSSATLTFVCQESLMLPKWIEALSHLNLSSDNKRNIPKRCSLPCLEEEEE